MESIKLGTGTISMLGFGDGLAAIFTSQAVSIAHSFRADLSASADCCHEVDAGMPSKAHPAIHG
jgi:hypothetical protein